jgi:hypothetical protein
MLVATAAVGADLGSWVAGVIMGAAALEPAVKASTFWFDASFDVWFTMSVMGVLSF